jgi:Flp pilus assembly protein TadG
MSAALRKRIAARLRMLGRKESGQAMPLVCVCFTAMLGLAAFSIEWGHATYEQRALQASTDAAALAAARALPTAASTAAITGTNGAAALYSAAPGGKNARPGLPNVAVSSRVECLSTLKSEGIACVGTVPDNAVQVTQTLQLPTIMGRIIGVPSITLNAISTAATRGGSPRPSNIAVIMDTTLSMTFPDTNCVVNGVVQTQIQCALNGFQILLKSLSPCGNYQTTCTNNLGVNQNPFDQVSLFTFPNLALTSASSDTSCTTPIPSSYTWYTAANGYIVMPPSNAWWGVPSASPYTTPTAGASSYVPDPGGTYQLTGFLSDYRTSNAATVLNPNSALVKAAGAVSNCGSMLPSNFDGVYGTYYAGAIYAAQAALTAQQVLNPNSENVIILLSDGNASAPGQYNGPYPVFGSAATGNGLYPSWVGQCGQAIVAANAATAAGTLFYTVAYGSEPTGCASDANAGSNVGVSPCDTMYEMASAPQYFYSDYHQSGSVSTCYSSQPVTALSDIFQAIANDLTEARLIPNNTT